MFKLAVVLLATVLVIATHSFAIGGVGGYKDRPELLEDSNIRALASYVVEHLAVKDQLFLDQVKVTRVQTQLVAGVNYKLDFIARHLNGASGKMTTCEATIYVRFDSTKQIINAQCNKA